MEDLFRYVLWSEWSTGRRDLPARRRFNRSLRVFLPRAAGPSAGPRRRDTAPRSASDRMHATRKSTAQAHMAFYQRAGFFSALRGPEPGGASGPQK